MATIRGIGTSFVRRPLCTANGIIVSVVMIWLGCTILVLEPDLTKQQLQLYRGPMTFAGLHEWGIAFVIGGVFALVRVILLSYQKIGYFLHLPTLVVAMGWGIAFLFGPQSTGKPLYTFFAAYVLIQPFIPGLVMTALKLGGFKVVTPEQEREAHYDKLRDYILVRHYGE